MDKELTKEQQDYLKQQLILGSNYEEMTRSEGWKFVQAWYQTELKNFINALMNQEKLPIEDFENARQQLIGFKKFLSHIDSAIKTLKDEQSKNK